MANPNTIKTILEQARQEFIFSAYQCVIESPKTNLSFAGGATTYWKSSRLVDEATLFDLASLTKPLCTVSILARLFEKGAFKLDQELGDVAPEWKKTPYHSLRVGELLSHSSGLKDWYPLYESSSWKEILLSQPDIFIENPQRKTTRYSDIGFLLLGTVVESLSQESLTKMFEKEVVSPLGLKNVNFGPVSPENCAATEWRKELGRCLQGEPFDENTAALKGTAPHAGLFSSAKEIQPLCREWLRAVSGTSHWLNHKTAKLFTSRTQFTPNSSWAFGWDTRSFEGSSAGSLFSANSFGHLGYTGTSIWIDPVAQGFCIFLTNRVHPSRLDERIRRFRPLLHDEVARYWKEMEK